MISDIKANEVFPSTSIPLSSSVNQLNDTPTPPWYRRQRQIINSRTIIICTHCLLYFQLELEALNLMRIFKCYSMFSLICINYGSFNECKKKIKAL